MSILNNTTKLQSLLDKINALPEASNGVELPELSNAASAGELLAPKQLIDGDGDIVTGTMPNNGAINETFDGIFTKSYTVPAGYTSGGTVKLDDTIDNIVTEQTTQLGTNAALIQQIKTALEGKAAGGGSGGESVETCMVRVEDSSRSSTCKYTNEGQELATVGPGSDDTTLTVMKNSYMYVAGGAGSLQVTGNASIEYGYTNRFVILITGDAGVSFAYNVDPT